MKYDEDGQDLYVVATYTAPMGDGMALVPSAGLKWVSRTGDNDETAFKFFGSLLFKAPMYAVGARIVNTDPTVPTLEINQLQAAGGQLVSVERVGKLQRDAVPIARGRGARWFSVTNFNAVISHDTAVIFDLSPN